MYVFVFFSRLLYYSNERRKFNKKKKKTFFFIEREGKSLDACVLICLLLQKPD